jgi:hypothetical protein
MNLIEKYLGETSPVNRDEIGATAMAGTLSFEKILKSKAINYFDGIHGIIVVFENKGIRFSQDDIKKLARMKFRWIDFSGMNISVGFEHDKK